MMQPNSVFPRYDGYCFANLPPTIDYWLTGRGAPALAPELMQGFDKQYDLVILLFIDSFGWQFVERYSDELFLERFARDGRLAKITSQFPSTTAAHVTCINTGLPVGRSGVYEWQYYEPKLDAVIMPLMFSYAGDRERNTLERTRIDPAAILPQETLYARLQTAGVSSHTFGDRSFTPSPYSNVVMRGATLHGYATLADALVGVTRTAAETDKPAYLMLYFGDVDLMCHLRGPDTLETQTQALLTLYALERFLLRALRGKFRNALLLFTADHGHMAVTPQDTRYINTEPALKSIVPLLRTNAQGQPLVPAGSPRDAFLYVQDDKLAEAKAILQKGLDGYAEVVETRELLARGYFGGLPVCADLLARLGNLTILPGPNHCVWWYEDKRFIQRFFGQHGGLSPTEMEIPLGIMELG